MKLFPYKIGHARVLEEVAKRQLPRLGVTKVDWTSAFDFVVKSIPPARQLSSKTHRMLDIRLPDKGNSNSHGARPVHQKHGWIRTSRFLIKNSLSLQAVQAVVRRSDMPGLHGQILALAGAISSWVMSRPDSGLGLHTGGCIRCEPRSASRRSCVLPWLLSHGHYKGYLAHKKTPSPRTVQWGDA